MNINKYLQKKDFYIRLSLIPLILIIISAIFAIIILHLQLEVRAQSLRPLAMPYTLHSYPTLGTFSPPDISAQAAAIYDPDSGIFLYTKNPAIHFSMASTTKLMTAIVALAYFKQDSILTVQRDWVEGTVLNLYKGEKFTFNSLLYAMLLNSANDAAYAVADNYPGGMTGFVKAMNAKARQLNLWNTQFNDSAGLLDDNDFSTVTELAKLAAIASQQPLIAQIVDTKEKMIYTADRSLSYPLQNLNQLLGYDGVIGIKTGTTEGAGQVLITKKQENGHDLIIVVMDSTDRYSDTLTLLHLIDTNIRFIDPIAMLKQ